MSKTRRGAEVLARRTPKPLRYFFDSITSFGCFPGQLALMFLLLRRLLGRERERLALAATAVCGLHPISAETVNYVIQRGEILSTPGVVGGLLLYARTPRPLGWHLAAMLAGCLAKPPAVVMTPPMATTGGGSPAWYVATQPWVALHYFCTFFWPSGLSADTDWTALRSLARPEFVFGVGFVLVFIGLIVASARSRDWRPEAFGLSWWLLGLLPTALVPLAEVLNDHRMYLPSVGLSLAVLSAADRGARAWIERDGAFAKRIVAVGMAGVLAGAGYATHLRNEVWRSEATLWFDVTRKSPKNGRGLMNYGLTRMAKGEYPAALSYFERALVLYPNYAYAETNLGIVLGAMKRDREAETHFRRAMTLLPVPVAHPFFARYLRERSRNAEARAVLEDGLRLQPDHWDMRVALLTLLEDTRDYGSLRQVLADTRARFPGRTELDRFDATLRREAASARPDAK